MRGFITVLFIRLLAIVLLAGSTSALAQQPNIVVILTDDQADSETLATMPILNQEMAQKGIVFTNSFVDFPLCCPSRSSWLTGLSAHNHHVLNNTSDLDGGYAKFYAQGWEDHSIGIWLQNAGYKTALIGKYLNQYPKNTPVPVTHIPPGWDEWRAFLGGALYYKYKLNENGVITIHGSTPADYSTYALTKKAVQFIRNQAKSTKPFFLLLTPNAPHTGPDRVNGYPMPTPAPRDLGKFSAWPLPAWLSFNEADVSDKPGFVQRVPLMNQASIDSRTIEYRSMRETMLAVDDMVGRVILTLETSGKLNNTIVIYTSDNGILYGQHRLRGKQVLYEQSMRVPLLMRGPHIPTGEIRDQMVNNLDVVATIVAAARAVPDHTVDGRNLFPLIKDATMPWRTAMLGQGWDFDASTGIYYPMIAIRTAQYVYGEHQSDKWGSEYELYDLQADPDQMANSAGDPAYQTVRNQLASILVKLKSCFGAHCWYTSPITTAAPVAASAVKPQSPVYRAPAAVLPSRRDYDIRMGNQEARELE